MARPTDSVAAAFLVGFFCAVGVAAVLHCVHMFVVRPRAQKHKQVCLECANKEGILDIFSIRHNIASAIENMILLEEHLAIDNRRCKDCQAKHMWAITGLLAEGVTLATKDQAEERRVAQEAEATARDIRRRLSIGVIDEVAAAGEFRKLRKRLAPYANQW